MCEESATFSESIADGAADGSKTAPSEARDTTPQSISSILSEQTMSVWGKSDRADNQDWLPLYVHMADSCHSAEELWSTWVPDGTKKAIARSFGDDIDIAHRVTVFLAAVHDVGKATPVFQCKTWGAPAVGNGENSLWWKPAETGLKAKAGVERRSRPVHPIAGQVIIEEYAAELGFSDLFARSLGVIIGGHHGSVPNGEEVREARFAYAAEMGSAEEYGDSWKHVQRELISFAEMISGLSLEDLVQRQIDYVMPQCEALLTGIVIMADWIASNTDYFPLVPLLRQSVENEEWQGSEEVLDSSLFQVSSLQELKRRAEAAWERVDITPAWEEESDLPKSVEELFSRRFHLPEGAHPRPVQSAVVSIMKQVKNPGIVVIEAPMGEGKTEAALAAAEILAHKTGRGGVCVALPTMATTDAMFNRVADWVNALPQPAGLNEKSIYLAHGKAALNERFQGIISASKKQSERDFAIYDEHGGGGWNGVKPEVIAADWFWGRKRGVLANFLVCTVDQVLMSSLQMRHVVLRQLAIANKVVVIDECHAYDIYMRQYLLRTLEWLGGMGTPVILLSATLPEELRSQMVDSYLAGRKAKPRVSLQGSFLSRLTASKRNASRVTAETGQVASNQIVEASADKVENSAVDTSYPLITYSDEDQVQRQETLASSRETTIECTFLPDDLESLLKLVGQLLVDGGCIGIICDVVARAQEVACVMEQYFGSDIVKLVHSRFIDIDRMNNESELRTLLGPPTEGGTRRPEKLIVVGTQVLEQSLDVDFDALIIDVAPIDLMLQRMGRMHRHARGTGESQRPKALRTARCYIRGIDEWEQSGPAFSKGIDYVYYPAALIEALSVLEMTAADARKAIHLPDDIAPLVRTAYSSKAISFVGSRWKERYEETCEERSKKDDAKQQKSQTFLMQSLSGMIRDRRCLGDDEQVSMGNVNDEKGQRAVRDTEDTIEVILLQKRGGGIGFLPWLVEGAQDGGCLSVDVPPSEQVAKIAAQCSVRLPAWMSRGSLGDDIVTSLEDLSEPYVMQWQDSKWLAGKLIVPLDEALSAEVSGWRITYSERKGLFVEKVVDSEDLD